MLKYLLLKLEILNKKISVLITQENNILYEIFYRKRRNLVEIYFSNIIELKNDSSLNLLLNCLFFFCSDICIEYLLIYKLKFGANKQLLYNTL